MQMHNWIKCYLHINVTDALATKLWHTFGEFNSKLRYLTFKKISDPYSDSLVV